MRTETTYPVFIGGRLRELTAEQIAAKEWQALTPDQKITVLLGRVELLERQVADLSKARAS